MAAMLCRQAAATTVRWSESDGSVKFDNVSMCLECCTTLHCVHRKYLAVLQHGFAVVMAVGLEGAPQHLCVLQGTYCREISRHKVLRRGRKSTAFVGMCI